MYNFLDIYKKHVKKILPMLEFFLWMTYQTMQQMGLDAASIFASVNLPNQPPDKKYS